MAWLIESYLDENSDIKKAIEEHRKGIKEIDDAMKDHIERIEYDAEKRIARNPEKEKTINKMKMLKVNAVKRKAELMKQKYRNAIDKLDKAKEEKSE